MSSNEAKPPAGAKGKRAGRPRRVQLRYNVGRLMIGQVIDRKEAERLGLEEGTDYRPFRAEDAPQPPR